jgi:long-chain acyl-CoA synthetase
MLAKGGCIGYWQGEIPKVLADIGACRPTLFCGVPRVFDRIYAGINDQLAGSFLKRLVFLLCLARKKAYMAAGWRHDKASPLADLLVFNNIKQKLGGQVRLILSGAAPLAPPVQEFLAVAMCAPVLQGYGLTETCAASCIAEPFKWESNGTVGGPMPGVEVGGVCGGGGGHW